jgi:hypothetical protein
MPSGSPASRALLDMEQFQSREPSAELGKGFVEKVASV